MSEFIVFPFSPPRELARLKGNRVKAARVNAICPIEQCSASGPDFRAKVGAGLAVNHVFPQCLGYFRRRKLGMAQSGLARARHRG
ncbi:MAG TPA: hypothetical protein VGF97_02650 [Rhizomicrobium sp.]|jgi:hypothetical protein